MKRNTMAKLACVLALAWMWCASTSVANAWDSAPKAGTRKVLTINGVEYAFRWCPAGTFIMGSPTTEGKRRMENETQHPVTLDGFWILETEVTQEMWKSVMGTNPSYFSSTGDGSDKVSEVDTSRFPAECVTWLDFQNFVLQLNRLNVAPTGFAFRFPWEAEWEYACRAGTTGPYNVEDFSLGALGWYNGNSDERTHAVGGKLANAWGLCDMHGNVCEWCADLDGWDCQLGNGVPMRFLRGGYWLGDAEFCRSAKRVMLPETSAGKTNGCRLVLASCESWERQVNRFRQDYELLERQRAALEAAMWENEQSMRQLIFEGKMQRYREKMDDLNTQRRLNALQEEQNRLDWERARNIGRFYP